MVTAGAVSKSRILTQPLRFVRMAKMQGAETEDEGSAFRRKARMSIATRQIGYYYTRACARVYMVHSVAGLCYGIIVKAMISNEKRQESRRLKSKSLGKRIYHVAKLVILLITTKFCYKFFLCFFLKVKKS